MEVAVAQWKMADDHYFAETTTVDGWRSGSGSLPVCLSAPHAATQIREGKQKIMDLYTGGLAESVALASGASFIATIGKQTGDPNWDHVHPYRNELLKLSGSKATVLDLHGMRDDRGVLINIGLGLGERPRERRLAALLVEAGLERGIDEIGINYPFSGSGRTITSWLQQAGVACLQIEIALSLRDYHAKPENGLRLLDFLYRATQLAAQQIKV